jgi:hypothetical protein
MAADETRMRDTPKPNIRQSHERYRLKFLMLRLYSRSIETPFQ